MMASILQQEGYRVGLYTSPHLVRFTERIKVNGNEIEEEEVSKLTGWMRGRIEAAGCTAVYLFRFYHRHGPALLQPEDGRSGHSGGRIGREARFDECG